MATQQHRAIRYSDPSQETDDIRQLVAEVEPMLTQDEEILYIAAQGRHAPTMQAVSAAMGISKKQAVIATSTRLMLYRPGLIGNARFIDIPWLEVDHVHIKQGFFGTTFEVQRLIGQGVAEKAGVAEEVPYLDKDQAKRLFSVCQEIEQRSREERRLRRLEEERATAGGASFVMNTPAPVAGGPVPAPTPGPAASDPVAKLAQAKAMLDQGLLSPEEYASIRARILSTL